MAILEKFRRLSEMSLSEIHFRASQALRAKKEQLQLVWDGERFKNQSWWHVWNPDKVSEGELQGHLRADQVQCVADCLASYVGTRKRPNFFWELAERNQIVARFKDLFPGRVDEITGIAEAVANHRFQIFRYPEFSYGPKISWRRDPVHGIESGLKHRASLSPLDIRHVGDSKNVWEINRHQHFFTLCLAYLLTQEERYAQECLAQWEDWMRENPYPCGINWASSLEVAFRSWSWVWMIYFLLGSRALTGDRIGRIVQGLSRNARFVAENLSTYFAPNTHLLGEGFSLFVVGLLFPELEGAQRWHDDGRAVLTREMSRQVRDDGSHFEQSIFYHRYSVEFFLCAAILADRNGCPFPESYRSRLEKMMEFLLYTSKPSGSHPSIGDSDGGRLIPFGSFDAEDHRPILSTAAVYFNRLDFRKPIGSIHEQTIWLLGTQAIAKFEAIGSVSPPGTSRTFADAGLVTMRSGWGCEAKFMLFDVGPHGVMHAGHAHADALSIICSANGVDWLVDPGTYVYTGSRSWRDYFRSTAAHNTIVIDVLDQATAFDWFKWKDLPEVCLEVSLSNGRLDYAVGYHLGYARLSQPVSHRRRVLFVKPDYWLVSDELSGVGEHSVSISFHFGPGVSAQLLDKGCLLSKGNERFWLLFLAPGMRYRLVTGQESPLQGWYSTDYGHRQPATVLLGEMQTDLPRRFEWLLCPAEDELQKLEVLSQGNNFSVHLKSRTDHILVGESPAKNQSGEISSDARVVVLRQNSRGSIQRLDVVRGSSVCTGGGPVLLAGRPFEDFCAAWHEDTLVIEARPLQPFQIKPHGAKEVRINGKSFDLLMDDNMLRFQGEH